MADRRVIALSALRSDLAGASSSSFPCEALIDAIKWEAINRRLYTPPGAATDPLLVELQEVLGGAGCPFKVLDLTDRYLVLETEAPLTSNLRGTLLLRSDRPYLVAIPQDSAEKQLAVYRRAGAAFRLAS